MGGWEGWARWARWSNKIHALLTQRHTVHEYSTWRTLQRVTCMNNPLMNTVADDGMATMGYTSSQPIEPAHVHTAVLKVNNFTPSYLLATW